MNCTGSEERQVCVAVAAEWSQAGMIRRGSIPPVAMWVWTLWPKTMVLPGSGIRVSERKTIAEDWRLHDQFNAAIRIEILRRHEPN